MSRKRTVTVAVLGILLTTTLAAGNLVFAAHATMLDPDSTKATIEDEGGFETLAEAFEEPIAANAGLGADPAAGETDSLRGLVVDDVNTSEVVTTEWARSELGGNVDRTYAYLHGNAERLNLSLDARPLATNLGAEVETAVENTSTAALFGAMDGDAAGDLPVDESTIERLDGDRASYRDAQEEVRSDVREEVLDAAVDDAYAQWSNDELLALVIPDYDPQDYSEAEKEQMVAERESEIESALRTYLERERGDEIESAVDDQLDAMAADAKASEVSTGMSAADEPARELTATVVDALVGDIDHATYQERSASARADLATAVGESVERDFAETTGDTIDLNEAMEIDERPDMGGAPAIVTWFDRLALVLPILAVGLIGLVYYVTRSVGRTAGTVGWSLVWVGVPAFVGATILAGRLPDMLAPGEDPDAMQSLFAGVVRDAVGHFAAQSLAIAVVGILLVGAVLAHKYDVVDRAQDAV